MEKLFSWKIQTITATKYNFFVFSFEASYCICGGQAGWLFQERLFNPNLDVEILDKTNKTWMSSSEWVVDYS